MTELLSTTFQTAAYQPQEALFWIPIIIGAAVLIGGTALVAANSGSTETTTLIGYPFLKSCSLGVLGMPEAGKTHFLNKLRRLNYSNYEQTISASNYDSFLFTVGDKIIQIKKGVDIGGDEYNIKNYYESFLKDKDVVIFLFDVQKYLDNEAYRTQTNARLFFINQKIGINELRRRAVIGTHVDKAKIPEGQNIILMLQKLIENKPYSRLFMHNFLVCDLNSISDIDQITRKLFL